MIDEPGRRRRRILGWGTSWGIAITLVEQLAFTPGDAWATVSMLLWWLTVWLTPWWCLVGCIFVWLADRCARRNGLRDLLLGGAAVAAISAVLQPLLTHGLQMWLRDVLPLAAAVAEQRTSSMPFHPLTMSVTLYNLWINLFYGGLLMAAYSLSLRRERTRSLLHATAIARNRTQTMLDEARLQALQRQVAPALLLDSMSELEKRYRNEPDAAERLLESLVEFLRCAMPGLRQPLSTVEAEFRLARAYVNLQQERGMPSGWRIAEPPSNALHAQFPSLLVLPLLTLGTGGGHSLFAADAANGRVTLTLSGLREASRDFMQLLQTRLHSLYGRAFTVERDPSTPTALDITLMIKPTTRSAP